MAEMWLERPPWQTSPIYVETDPLTGGAGKNPGTADLSRRRQPGSSPGTCGHSSHATGCWWWASPTRLRTHGGRRRAQLHRQFCVDRKTRYQQEMEPLLQVGRQRGDPKSSRLPSKSPIRCAMPRYPGGKRRLVAEIPPWLWIAAPAFRRSEPPLAPPAPVHHKSFLPDAEICSLRVTDRRRHHRKIACRCRTAERLWSHPAFHPAQHGNDFQSRVLIRCFFPKISPCS